MAGRLEGKVAIVTGAARGTGEATARALVREGATVWIADLLNEAGEQVASDLGDAARFIRLDVTDEAQWSKCVEEIIARDERIDVLVNNAALLHLGSLLQTSADDFRRLNEVNQIGPFLGIRAVFEAMKSQGGGSIVNIASVDGFLPKNGVIAYASTKFALRGLTKVAAVELGKYGIRVNAVCPEAGGPGMVNSVLPEGMDAERVLNKDFNWPILHSQHGRGVAERLDDIANLIVYLAGDESRSCTGADFVIDGGHSGCRLSEMSPMP
ncbi:MAG: SDR family oxidoreductase [Myxococcota bacterium]|jgi:3alpha(or 20beta)-hydroxysteroid dehydrogenase|nr:SDR family oxidoreductase [Myxococcota bacterium]